MIQTLERVFNNTDLNKSILKQLRSIWGDFDMNTKDTKKIVEAFSLSMKEVYTPIPEGWTTITVNKAHTMLKPHIGSANTIKTYIKDKWLRSIEGQPYLQEIEMLKSGLDIVEMAKKEGILGSQKVNGQKMIVFFPEKISIQKLHPTDQFGRAFMKIVKEDWFQSWMDHTDTSD